VQTALKPRCIGCNNCVLACPFGVPKMRSGMNLMMKCDMCYDRTSVGKKPMCASVCPSQALLFGTRAEVASLRPGSRILNSFQFGGQTITTKVNMLVPARAALERLDVLSALHEPPVGNDPAADPMASGLAGTEADHAG
jgi:Fe-S-cluster-containing dehydrogenase component